ncbi:MAG TPA: adenylate/guanylate cyclase domain-containing protein [Mycobacterium sp.]|nr:adenylate/guanylate cyclase domain-containing protein [Mycobacterium sp.]
MPETSYAPCGDLSLAYQVFGRGPVELVWAGSFASHVELYWSMPEFRSLMERLGTFARIILFDKAGVGLSDPVPKVRTLDERATEIEAVMDAAGFKKAAILGVSEGGPAAILFAATRPERTRALILTGATAYAGWATWDDLERDPAELRARGIREVGENYAPSIEQIAGFQRFGRAVKASWGSGNAAKCLLPSVKSMRQLGMFERMSASPGMARATLEAAFQIDVRAILPTITVPVLVVHAREDPGVPIQSGRYLADHIRGARMLELDGTDHAPWFTDPARIASEIEELLTGGHAAPPQSQRALRTVLFTDIVASTERAAATGDERWRAVLQRFGEITAEASSSFGGTVVKSTGDGHLFTFDGPTQAIRCAEALRDGAETLGIEIRSGIHTGECELMDADIGGIAVHIAARILGEADGGDVLVSRTVRDLVVGSGMGFEDRGVVELRGVPGSWELLAVNRHGAHGGSAEAKLASLPTPGPRAAMRRSDRAVAVMAKRAPWILRRAALLTGNQGGQA